MTYLILIYEFFKAGLFAIGGGMATLPFLYRMAGKYTWFDMKTLADMIAVSESTPGAIGINMATYAGNMCGGVLGGILATAALVCPSIIIITIIAKMLDRFNSSKWVQRAMQGIRPAAAGLIAAAGFQLFTLAICDTEAYQKTGEILSLINWKYALIFVMIVAGVFKFKKHPIVYIVIAAVIGVVFQL